MAIYVKKKTFISSKIAKNSELTINGLQAIEIEEPTSRFGLLSLLLKDHPFTKEIHPNFCDPIGIRLEETYHKK
ncbi:hypothetical protein, partial [Actinobacillus pleuropneumoniae]